jgi:hypothetical protein
MTLSETKGYVLKWIESCQTNEQTGLLESAIKETWIKRYEGEVPDLEFKQTQKELSDAIKERMLIIAGTHLPTQSIPTIDRYDKID